MHFVMVDHFTLTYIKMVKNIRKPHENNILSHGLAMKNSRLFYLPVSPKKHTKSLNVYERISSTTHLTTTRKRFVTPSALGSQKLPQQINIRKISLSVQTKHSIKPKQTSGIKYAVEINTLEFEKINH